MENIPPFPKGKNPPAPLAKFQNNVNNIEKTLYQNIGVNNDRVFPKIPTRGRSMAEMENCKFVYFPYSF